MRSLSSGRAPTPPSRFSRLSAGVAHNLAPTRQPHPEHNSHELVARAGSASTCPWVPHSEANATYANKAANHINDIVLLNGRNTWSNPEQVRGLENIQVRDVSASGVVSAAIGSDGSLWVWGRSKRGQLGLGKDIIEAAVPSRVEALASYNIVKVSFGWGHAMALTKDGKLFGWGYSENGRLGEMGQSTTAPSAEEYICKTEDKYSRSVLEAVEKMVEEKIRSEDNMPIIWKPSLIHEVSHLEVSDMSCGLDHSLIICSNGVILSGGDNTYGQLGRKPGLSKLLPVDMSCRPFSVSPSVGHSLALCHISTEGTDGGETSVLSWGWNNSSQLGRPGPEDVPSVVDGLRGERPVSASAGRISSEAQSKKPSPCTGACVACTHDYTRQAGRWSVTQGPSRFEQALHFAGGGGGRMGLGGRGAVGERWSQRILWMCAIGSAVSLYFVAVERQAQNRARAMAEGLKALDCAGGPGEDV
ncbi:hypothetical protein PR202_ga06806 [Eleusine coracana subsp. coracana]|uniref:RCC1-like domain-containing protein n=1 Tax=Eleusine coracana subsp. coracana TaxID=191504 RepID=A0AAV5BZA4_ELECO|nr:hypothetical protein PR202_ga06806 [Eleusine coracana subsp. coracana]